MSSLGFLWPAILIQIRTTVILCFISDTLWMSIHSFRTQSVEKLRHEKKMEFIRCAKKKTFVGGLLRLPPTSLKKTCARSRPTSAARARPMSAVRISRQERAGPVRRSKHWPAPQDKVYGKITGDSLTLHGSAPDRHDSPAQKPGANAVEPGGRVCAPGVRSRLPPPSFRLTGGNFSIGHTSRKES